MKTATVTKTFQIGTKVPDSISEFVEVVNIPVKEKTMSEVVTDVEVSGKAVISSNYQSVHFGVNIRVKDVPLDSTEDFSDILQGMVQERIKNMKPEADDLLQQLLEDR